MLFHYEPGFFRTSIITLLAIALWAMALVTTLYLKHSLASEILINHDRKHRSLEYGSQVESARKSSKKLYQLVSDSKNAFYDEVNMVLGYTYFSNNTYSRQPYVSNGYIGSRIPNIGFGYALDTLNIWTNSSDIPGALNNGWPLRNHRFAGAFVSDFYSLESRLNSTNFPELDDKGYTSVIASIPQWTDLRFSIKNDSSRFNANDVLSKDITNYNQNLSMADGIVTTELDWLDYIHVKSSVFTHKRIYPLGVVSLEISLNIDRMHEEDFLDLQISDVLNYTTSHRTVLRDIGYDDQGIYMVVEPNNIPYSNAALYSSWEVHADPAVQPRTMFRIEDNGTSVSQTKFIRLSGDMPTVRIDKYVGIMSSEFNTLTNSTNIELSKEIVAENLGKLATLRDTHKSAWSDLYNDAFIEIPSDSLLEMTARSSLYHLLANTRQYNVSENRGLPVPVSGLSSDSYGGMVFWDADMWILPALLPFFPDIAKHMNNYRNGTHHQAQLNAKEYGYRGALYPWTSARFANCTSTGPCLDYEYHINVDIAMSSFSIYMNGAEGIDDEYLRYTTWPLVRDAAQFFTDYVKYNDTIGMYETHNLTDPDEFANFINNGAFTNAGIKSLLKWATDIGNHLDSDEMDPRWIEISEKMYIPTSEANITLEYSSMNSSVEIKQADVVLMIYPLGYITDESILSNAIKNLYYYSERQSASGPAMTYPVFVAAASSLLNHGCSSQSYLYKSVLPYLRSPFAQFSEQSDDNFLTNGLTQPAFPFLTAHGGFLQAILFGLTGLRYSYEVDSTTKKISRLLKFNPIRLPLLPGGIAIRNFKYMNQVLDIILDDHNGTIIHKSGDRPIRIKVPDRNIICDRDITTVDDTKRLLPREDDKLSGSYYTLEPDDELVIPLYEPKLNIHNNIVEGKHVTNLTAGVPGDVPMSALDGNNFTHWQPLNKSKPGKLLIDLGPEGGNEIRRGRILWGQRPARNISISVLPYTEEIERLLDNITEITNIDSPMLYISNETSKNGRYKSPECESPHLNQLDGYPVDNDIKELLSWKLFDIEQACDLFWDFKLLGKKFIKVVDDLEIIPSERYYQEVYNKSQIVILPSNETLFDIDYSNTRSLNIGYTDIDFESNDTAWRNTRFILVAVEGSYDDDDDPKGGTIKEIAFS